MNQESHKERSDTGFIEKMLAGSGYSDKAIRYYIEKPYIGAITDDDQASELTGSCGDTMRISLKLKDGVVVDARYQVL